MAREKLTRAFLAATAALLESRLFLPGIFIGVLSIGSCCGINRRRREEIKCKPDLFQPRSKKARINLGAASLNFPP
jgi:hypothetical protein